MVNIEHGRNLPWSHQSSWNYISTRVLSIPGKDRKLQTDYHHPRIRLHISIRMHGAINAYQEAWIDYDWNCPWRILYLAIVLHWN